MGQEPHPPPQAALTQTIYRLMGERNLNRNALARAAGIDDTSFYRKLDRKPHTFSVEDLLGIADALEVTIPELFKAA